MNDHIEYTEPCKVLHQYTWKARMGDIDAQGKTKSEAREALMEKVHAALTGTYTPTMIFCRKRYALIWREQNGWYYTVQPIGPSGQINNNFHFYETLHETERRARKHLADYVMDDEIAEVKSRGGILYFSNDFFVEMLLSIGDVILDDYDGAHFIDEWKYQRKVARVMKEQGVDFEEAWRIADGPRGALRA